MRRAFVALVLFSSILLSQTTYNVDSCYIPLEVGNEWIFLYKHKINYNNNEIKIVKWSITGSTIINNKKYYILNDEHNIRYDLDSNALFQNVFGTDYIMIDFDYLPGTKNLTSYLGHEYVGEDKINNEEFIFMGDTISTFGYNQSMYNGARWKYFAKGLGFTDISKNELRGDNWHEESHLYSHSLIEAKIKHDTGFVFYTQQYKPALEEISPSLDTNSFYLSDTLVTIHEYNYYHTDPFTYFRFYRFVNSVTMRFQYRKNNKVVHESSYELDKIPYDSYSDLSFGFSMNFLVSRPRLTSGHDLYYQLIGKDSYIYNPNRVVYPEVGWYVIEAIAQPPDDDDEEEEEEEEEDNKGDMDYSLKQNYPNPFNNETRISFITPEPGTVKIIIYDLLGQEVKTLINEYYAEGDHLIDFNAGDLGAGVYYYQITVNHYSDTKKMILLK